MEAIVMAFSFGKDIVHNLSPVLVSPFYNNLVRTSQDCNGSISLSLLDERLFEIYFTDMTHMRPGIILVIFVLE